jgi:hypothetical protein
LISDFQKLGKPVLGQSEKFFPDSFHPWQFIITYNIQILLQKCKTDAGEIFSHGVRTTEFGGVRSNHGYLDFASFYW